MPSTASQERPHLPCGDEREDAAARRRPGRRAGSCRRGAARCRWDAAAGRPAAAPRTGAAVPSGRVRDAAAPVRGVEGAVARRQHAFGSHQAAAHEATSESATRADAAAPGAGCRCSRVRFGSSPVRLLMHTLTKLVDGWNARFPGDPGPPRRSASRPTAAARAAAAWSSDRGRRTSPARTRLADIREALRSHGAAALLVPSSDPHLSEYLPERWQGRRWPSGFTGSVATLVVTPRHGRASSSTAATGCRPSASCAGSDDRAGEAAPRPQHRSTSTGCATQLSAGAVVAVDGDVLGLAAARRWRRGLGRCGIVLRTTSTCSDDAWTDRAGAARGRGVRASRRRRRRNRGADRLERVRAPWRGRAHAPSALHGRRHRLAAQPARRRRRLQPGFPGPSAGRADVGDAVRRPGQDRRRPGRPAGRRRHRRRRGRRRGRRAGRTAHRRDAAARSAPRHARLAPQDRREGGRGGQPEHALQEPQERRRGRQRAPGDGRGRRRDVRVLCGLRNRARPIRRAAARSPS